MSSANDAGPQLFLKSLLGILNILPATGRKTTTEAQCPRTDLSKRFLPKQMTTTG